MGVICCYCRKRMKQTIIVEIICKMMIKTLVLILFSTFSQAKYLFMPNLPMGEYRAVIDKIYQCESTKNYPLRFNWYLSKKTSSITELKENMTSLIPFDDTLTLDYNFASWGSTGGWIPNSNIIKTKNACSSVKHLCGNAWLTIIKGFNIQTDGCPVPAGTYITPGFDLKKLEDNNFPKVYFYGKYKISAYYKNEQNKVVGCTVMEVNVIRPWETPI